MRAALAIVRAVPASRAAPHWEQQGNRRRNASAQTARRCLRSPARARPNRLHRLLTWCFTSIRIHAGKRRRIPHNPEREVSGACAAPAAGAARGERPNPGVDRCRDSGHRHVHLINRTHRTVQHRLRPARGSSRRRSPGFHHRTVFPRHSARTTESAHPRPRPEPLR